MMPQKPGGGGKPQPYIPAGSGSKSGEYTDKPIDNQMHHIRHCRIVNRKCYYNFNDSKLVGKVIATSIRSQGESIPKNGKPNTVIKKIIGGYVVSERYYNSNGEAYLDIDYTCHGNPKSHPVVPHIHRWIKDENGKLQRQPWEVFKWKEKLLKN